MNQTTDLMFLSAYTMTPALIHLALSETGISKWVDIANEKLEKKFLGNKHRLMRVTSLDRTPHTFRDGEVIEIRGRLLNETDRAQEFEILAFSKEDVIMRVLTVSG